MSSKLATQTCNDLGLDQLQALCARLARQLWDQEQSLCLHLLGDLGSGKTTFCQQLLAACGITDRVKSPTYTLLEPYAIGNWQICHIDLYRLNRPDEILHLGLEEYQSLAPLLLLIEWPQQGRELTPSADASIEFAISSTDANRRNLKLTAYSDKATRLLAAI